MTFQVNQKINPYLQQPQTTMGMNSESDNRSVAMGINTPPQLQNVNMETVVDNSALRSIKNNDDDQLFSFKTFLLSLPVTAAMVYGMDKFNLACKGKNYDYETSLVGRINDFGERVGKRAPFVDTVFRKIESFTNWFTNKVAPKTSITSSFFNHPSMPESPSVSMMAMGTHAEIASEAIGKLKEYAEQPGNVIKGTTKERIMELADPNTRRNMENVKEIMKICRDQEGAFLKSKHFGNVKSIWIFGRLFKKEHYLSNLFPASWGETLSRRIYFSEFANKIQAIVNPKGQSVVGQKLSKLTLRFIEGLTNGTAGGKFAVFMGAYFVADAIKKTFHAPKKKGEKRKVFAENMISNVGMYMTMPLSIIIMHKFGGLEYLGMGKGAKQTKNLESYRQEIEKLNKAVDEGTITKAAHKAKVKEINEIRISALKWLPTDSAGQKALKLIKKIVYRPIMGITSLLKVGLERIKPYTKDSGKTMKFIKNAWYKTKGGLGYPVRMGIFMFVIAQAFNKYLAKGSHLIFGRPEKSILDEGKEPEEQAPKSQVIGIPQQQGQVQPASAITPLQQNSNLANNQIDSFQRQNLIDMHNANTSTNYIASEPVQKENLLDMYKSQHSAPVMTPENNAPARSYIPSSSAPAMISASQEPARNYIPSSEGMKIVQTDDDRRKEEHINSLINKSNHAELVAKEALH